MLTLRLASSPSLLFRRLRSSCSSHARVRVTIRVRIRVRVRVRILLLIRVRIRLRVALQLLLVPREQGGVPTGHDGAPRLVTNGQHCH